MYHGHVSALALYRVVRPVNRVREQRDSIQICSRAERGGTTRLGLGSRESAGVCGDSTGSGADRNRKKPTPASRRASHLSRFSLPTRDGGYNMFIPSALAHTVLQPLGLRSREPRPHASSQATGHSLHLLAEQHRARGTASHASHARRRRTQPDRRAASRVGCSMRPSSTESDASTDAVARSKPWLRGPSLETTKSSSRGMPLARSAAPTCSSLR
jgi:hypothetical protein